MRILEAQQITATIARLCMEANCHLGADMLAAFDRALHTERSPAGREVLTMLKENARIARTERLPYCQDTGFVICFADVGQDLHISGGLLEDAINEGVRRGYTEGYLRASIVEGPFQRKNTGDNTPAVVHTQLVPGDRLSFMLMAKGGGCENRSQFKMCTPAEGLEGAKAFILGCIRTAGPDHINTYPCHIASLPVAVTIECHAHRHQAAVL